MEKITEVLNRNFSLHAGATQEELRAHIQSQLDNLNRLFSELEKPEFAEFIKFAIEWQKLECELRALQCKIRERKAEKPINKVSELLKKLVKKD